MNKHVCGHDILKLSLQGEDSQVSGSAAPRAMKIVFELTAGGKVINGRIYTPKALQSSIDSWTQPYAKPIQVFHDSEKDAIGRVTSVRVEDIQEEALKVLGGDFRGLAELVAAYDTNDPQKIYKAMSKYRLLNNPRWPGLVRMMAEARITDPDAVSKFQDERYLTLSAGQNFHNVVCGKDGQDWLSEGPCDHPPVVVAPGDKDATVFVIPSLDAREVSVVNIPANGTSYVREKIILGSDEEITRIFSAPVENADSLVIGRDAKFELEVDYEPIGWDQLKLLNPKIVASLVESGTLVIKSLGQLAGVPDQGFLQSVCSVLGDSTSEAAVAFRDLISEPTSSEDEMNKELLDQLLARLEVLEAKVAAVPESAPVGTPDADSQPELVTEVQAAPEPAKEQGADQSACQCGADCPCRQPDAQLQGDYAQALATVDELKNKTLTILKALADIKGVKIEQDVLQAYLEWFDAGAPAPSAANSADSDNQTIDTKGISGIASGADVLAGVPGDKPPPQPSHKELDRYAQFVVDRAQKIKAGRGIDAAKLYIAGQRQYLAPGVDLEELYKLIGD